MKSLLLFIFLSLLIWDAPAQSLPRPRLQALLREAPVVVVFLSTTCPICQKYAGMLPALQQKYTSIQWAGVFTKWEEIVDIQQFKQEYQLDFPFFVDKNNRLLRQLEASTTPEVLLLDKKGIILYRGAIDNWFYGLGKYRAKTTEHYLEDALDAYLQGKEIAIKKTEPIGCVIEQ